jgi:hypothetical protein
MKKTKKIPNTPKYKFGGGFDSKDKANVRNFIGNSAKMYADTALNAVGVDAFGAGKGVEYKGTSANKFNQASNVTGAVSKAVAPTVANVLLPGSGQFVSMGQQVAGGAYGQFGPQNEEGFNAYDDQGNPIMNEGDKSAQVAQIAGQVGGMASGFMGGSPGGMPSGATPAMVAKYGGYMKYAMGGMQYANGGTGQINSEVEKEENAVGPNNEFTQFDGPSHSQGGIKTDMAPGTRVFSDKLKAPGTNKTFAKLNVGNNTNREDKLDAKEYLDPKSKMSIDLTRMAKMKNSDMLFAMQEQLKKDKVAAYAKRMGVELPSMDNEQMEPQGMPEQAEGEMAMSKYGGMMNNMANGGMIKRADGSYSKRGLWDNIRANAGSGKAPTAEMLKQEAKINSKAMGGINNPGFNALPKEVQQNILSNMAMGGIHINPANKGKFTSSAQHAGMGTQEFANHVLANKEDYSSTQVKRANFAHNAAGWKHEMGGMQPYAMGGVQLPYYNINRDGTNKYAMGGMGVDPAMPAANTGTVAPTMSTPPQFGNRMEFDKYYQSQGYAKDPRNKLGSNVTYYNPNKYKYDQGTDSFKFANNEPVPYNSLPSSDLMEFKPGSGVQKVVNKKVPVGQQSLNKWDFNSGNPTKRYYNEAGELLKSEEYDNAGPSGKVINTIEPRRKLAYGGRIPKYEYGIRVPIGPEDPNAPVEMVPSQIYNPYGGVPNAPVFNPSRYGQGQYDPNDLQLKGNTTITETPDDALSTFRKQNPSTSDTKDTTGTGGSNNYNNKDMILQGLGMVAGIAPKAAYLKEQGKNYDTQQFYEYNPSLMDPTQARKDEQYAGRQNQENIRIGSMGSGATLLANAAAQRNKTSANLGRINKEYDNANVAITNRGKEYNIGNRYAVDDIDARNKGAALSNYYKTLDSTGAEVKQGTKDIRGGNQDKQMMAMIPKMMNNPEFKKFFEEYQKGQVG